MKEGILWFQADHNEKSKLSFETHLSRAAARFRLKNGSEPNACYIHESQFDPELVQVNGITIKPVYNIRPYHFLVGVERG